MATAMQVLRPVVVFGKVAWGRNADALRHHIVPEQPVPQDFYDDQGWVSRNDAAAMKAITKARAVGRAREKLTVLEWNALALYIKARGR